MVHRPRRLRSHPLVRRLVAETIPDKHKLIMPYFICDGSHRRDEILSMPGIYRNSIDNVLPELERDYNRGIDKILLFGIPETKDPFGSGAYAANGIVQKAIREIKKNFPAIIIITDVCLCEYTDHGHCGVVRDGKIVNDESLHLLAQVAVSHAEAGADIVAPSDMMDGRIAAIRTALDLHGFGETALLSYAAKYASAFYGPFRDAAGSAPQFGDRKTYQMDYRNSREAVKEALSDVEEGADIIMVKPGMAYLDIVKMVKTAIDLPLCVYNVSGEYAMVKLMASHGYANEEQLTVEIIAALFRAGADMIISYHTRDIFNNNWL